MVEKLQKDLERVWLLVSDLGYEATTCLRERLRVGNPGYEKIYIFLSHTWSMQCKLGNHICKETLTKLKGFKEGLPEFQLVLRNLSEDRLKKLSITTLNDRRIRGDLVEIYKVMSSRESIDWVKPLNLRKNVDISGPAVSVHGNSFCHSKLFLKVFLRINIGRKSGKFRLRPIR